MTVQLFATCLVESWRPSCAIAAEQLLQHVGVRVHRLLRVGCCGQVAFNAGDWDTARKMAIAWLHAADPAMPVVMPSGSCAATVRHNYALLLSRSRYETRWHTIANQTFELSQFLVEELQAELHGFRSENEVVTYHPSCHLLRMLQVQDAPVQLIRQVQGVQYVPLPEAEVCCGFGGLFAVHLPQLSGALLMRKLEAIEQTGASTVLGCDWSCLMHLAGGLHRTGMPVRAMHLAEWLIEKRIANCEQRAEKQ
ncbi:MAG: (Fe-S)-binding protein [Armatimonadota bacterium]